MDPIISLILPAYNVEKYIEACVNSCEQQDVPQDSYEVVIVNDGSTDEGCTSQKIQSLSQKYNNIKVINQCNQGLSQARNNGFKASVGKYVWFVDSDDTICFNCLGTLIQLMEKHQLDALTVGPSIPFIERFPQRFDEQQDVSAVYNGIDFVLYSKKFVVGAWCYIFSRNFWESNQLNFYRGITFEDTQLMAHALSLTNRVAALTSFSCYNYVKREGSIMHSKPNKHKLMSNAVIVNTHIQYADNSGNLDLRRAFMSSASGAFIDGINQIIQMDDSSKVLYKEFLAAIHKRPTYVYGKTFAHRLFQYFVLHFPYLYIFLRKR